MPLPDHGLIVLDERDMAGMRKLAEAVLTQAWEDVRTGCTNGPKSNTTSQASIFRTWLSAVALLLDRKSLWIAFLEIDADMLAERCHDELLRRYGQRAFELENWARFGWEGTAPPPWWLALRKSVPVVRRRRDAEMKRGEPTRSGGLSRAVRKFLSEEAAKAGRVMPWVEE
jgi:hypothetical protein